MDAGRNLIVCLDGTWNDVSSRTNVVRFYELLARDTGQLAYYDDGVGIPDPTEPWWRQWRERLRGGWFGAGLLDNVMQAYAWLARQYRAGDRIFILGFSRGAYTARMLASLVGRPGLPALTQDEAGLERAVKWVRDWRLHQGKEPTPGQTFLPVEVHFLGVWDTVGACGVPHWNWRPPMVRIRAVRFGNSRLPGHVRIARQALAVDEHRKDYAPVLWTEQDSPDSDIAQVWFPGAHAQIGGGYDDDLLCELPLTWMCIQASSAGLRFTNAPDACEAFVPPRLRLDGSEYLAPLIDSWRHFAGGLYRLVSGRCLRRVCVEGINESVHPSVWNKWANDPDYRPGNIAHLGRNDQASPSDADRPGDAALEHAFGRSCGVPE